MLRQQAPSGVTASILLPLEGVGVQCPMCCRCCRRGGGGGLCQADYWTARSCGPRRTREKILEGWKVYAGTTNLQQLPEAAAIAQIIVHGNYTDEEDDYDIALIRLSKPLPLSGECAHPTGLVPATPRPFHVAVTVRVPELRHGERETQ